MMRLAAFFLLTSATTATAAETQPASTSFLQGLHDHGYVEGRAL
jgi:hypothetical protein